MKNLKQIAIEFSEETVDAKIVLTFFSIIVSVLIVGCFAVLIVLLVNMTALVLSIVGGIVVCCVVAFFFNLWGKSQSKK